MQAALGALSGCDLFISVGTSAVVYPAAGMAATAAQVGALVTEINPEATPLTSAADLVVTGLSGEVLPAVVAALGGQASLATPVK
jgi:NAD-dependent deacetylase